MGFSDWLQRWSSSQDEREEKDTTSETVLEERTIRRAEQEGGASRLGEPVEGRSEKDSAEKDEQGDKFFELLEHHFQSPEFLDRLKASSPEAEPSSAAPLEERPKEDDSDDSFVWVTEEDAMLGLVETVASCVLSCPQAREMTPQELQKAILHACKDLKKSRARTAWGWCQFFYRATSWSYSAFCLYTNPWLVRALFLALWSVPTILWQYLF